MGKFYSEFVLRNPGPQAHAKILPEVVPAIAVKTQKAQTPFYTITKAKSKLIKPSRHEAILLFHGAIHRLLSIHHWERLCANPKIRFQLCDAGGRPLDVNQAEEGHLIRILEASDPEKPDTFYQSWIRIESLEQKRDLLKDEELFGFRGRILHHPKERAADNHNEVFISFLVVRTTSKVIVIERGRHELPLSWSSYLLFKMKEFFGRNTSPWKQLTKGIVMGPPEK